MQREYDADAAYERHLENRFDPDAMADLALHESQWPNGYGVCNLGACHLGIYHPGDCEQRFVAEASDLGWKPGQWKSELTLGTGEVATARSRVVDNEGELVAVVYAGKGFIVHVLND